jgi:hypothetical protein
MQALDFESDQFLQLLMEALRAGPGSPEWHEAVEALRIDGIAEKDEYRLLISARENLEKGKEYRSVRAGPGFGRKLNDALDAEATGKKGPPTTSMVAIVSAGLLLAAAAVLLYLLFPGGAPTAAIEKLSNTYFVEPILEHGFEYSIARDFDRIGSLKMDAQRGLHPVADDQTSALSGGGIVWTQKIAANQPIAIDVNLRVIRPTDDVIAEIFITDSDKFDPDKGTSGHEFLWLYQAGQTKVVLPDGKIENQTTPNRDFKGTMSVRIAIERDAAIVSQQNKPVWSGAHGLDSSKPRFVGLRFIKTGAEKSSEAPLAFTWIKISKPPKD